LDLTRGRSRRERARERRGDEASSRRALVISALRERFYDADVVHEQPSAAAQRERPRGRARRRAAISSAVAARRRPGREPPLRAALRRRHSHVWKRRVRLLRRRVPRPRLRRHRAKRECATSTRSCQHIRSPAIFRRRRCCSKSDKQKKREPRARVAACPPAAADAAAADTARAASPRGIARAKKKSRRRMQVRPEPPTRELPSSSHTAYPFTANGGRFALLGFPPDAIPASATATTAPLRERPLRTAGLKRSRDR
jgi:hypothetical protein